MPYMIQKSGPDDTPFCVYKKGEDGKPEGDALGCHESRDDAQRQIAAIWANENKALALPLAVIEQLCPKCAAHMRKSNLKLIKLVALKQMPDQLVEGLCAATPGESFSQCMNKDFGDFAPGDKEGFCAWLHYECTGQWPGEKSVKAGARHSAKDRQLLHGIRQKAREIDHAAVDLGAIDPRYGSPAPGKAALELDVEPAVRLWGVVKAAGDWELDILGIPFGGPDNTDADGQWFDHATKLHEDKWPLPPVVYYHGFGPNKRPLGAPAYIGKATRRWTDSAGVWFRVMLDRTSALARRVWEAAQKGIARASTGSASHLIRIASDGRILEWPVVELSAFDAIDGREPANRYAVAIPAAKALYESAGIALPQELIVPEAEPEAGQAASAARGNTDTGDEEMDPKEIEKLVADSIASALKAQRDADVAASKAKADAEAAQKAAVEAAVKAEKEKWETEAAKSRRLPLGDGVPYVRQFPYAAKFDHISLGEHALLLDVLEASKRFRGVDVVRDEALKALALRCEAEATKHAGARESDKALKALGLKANDINYSTYSGYGSQWVGTLYSRELWEAIRAECWVLAKMQPYSDQIPDGFSSDTVPLESTDPTVYKVAEATAHTSGRPDVTVTASKFATGNKNITVAKMGARATWTGELTEDSLVPIMPQVTRQMKAALMEAFEHAIIDGDTATAITTNINHIGGTPTATDVYLLVDGFRKLALVTNTANSRSGGVLDDEDFLETVKLLGTAGINADIDKVSFILDMPTYWKALTLANLKTKDVWANATLEKGQLTGIWGYPLKPSAFMHTASTVRKANTAGKVDQTTTTNNVTGSILAVRWDQWRLKWKRQITMETDRWPESDTNQLVALCRFGLGYRDTEASSITYGISGV